MRIFPSSITGLGDLEQIKTLITKDNKDRADTQGYTPLHWASQSGKINIVGYLISKGANINPKDRFGNAPLHLASKKGNLEIAKLLVRKGANINAVNKDGLTPVDVANGWRMSWFLKHPKSIDPEQLILVITMAIVVVFIPVFWFMLKKYVKACSS